MKHRFPFLCLSILAAIIAVSALRLTAAPQIEYVTENGCFGNCISRNTVRYIVRFVGGTENALAQAEGRGELIDALKEQNVQALGAISAELEDVEIKPLWIINGAAVVGTEETILQLANHPQVASIEPDETIDAPVNPLCGALAPSSRTLTPNPSPSGRGEQESSQFTLGGSACINTFTEIITETASLTGDFLPLSLTQYPLRGRWGPGDEGSYNTAWGVPHIRAPHVWHGLGIDGAGSVIAIMDTGVDWTHPLLQTNYRGEAGDHAAHWHDVTITASDFPTDTIGHGTHVAGSAVGQAGFGVAPNAEWIAVKIFEPDGFAYTSAILLGFQWLLAPNGDPSLAPDVVNNSWGGYGYSDPIAVGIEVLHEANIMTVNSAGNEGRFTDAVLSPAAVHDALAVGASDHRDKAAWFSSHGPSSFTEQYKPTISAPGVHVLSAYPDDQLAVVSGTSMAAPQVAGLVALLRQVDRTLDRARLTEILTKTVAPQANTPNHDVGWGVIDAYRAVAETLEVEPVRLQFVENSTALADLQVTIVSPDGEAFAFVADGNGEVEVWLVDGEYTISADSALHTLTESSLQIDDLTPATVIFEPTRRPSTTLSGRVTDMNGRPLTATISVAGTNLATASDNNGDYQFDLPLSGDVEVVATAAGHSTVRRVLGVVNRPMIAHFQLTPQGKTLLVNADAWRYDNTESGFYEQALRDLGHSYDVYHLYDPFLDVTAGADILPQYDHVIWSHPETSPSAIGAQEIISDYLGTGGDLLLSGRSVAQYENSPFFASYFWYYQLGLRHLETVSPTHLIQGQGASFADLSFQLNGSDSYRDQPQIDLLTTRERSLAEPILSMGDEQVVGMQTTHCQPFNALVLGFGVQGVSGRANRAALLASSFDTFTQPVPDKGLLLYSESIDDFVLPNQQLSYTVTVLNLSEVTTETVALNVDSVWETTVVSPTLTLAPCEARDFAVTVRAPAQFEREGVYLSQLVAETGRSSAEFPLTHRVPRDILLVDDDRFYDGEQIYIDTLTAMGVPFDIWETGWRRLEGRGEISAELLTQYDIVLWFTGADWFAPVTQDEREGLHQFVSNGGRLLLVSQDYLFYSHDHPLTKQLGVLDYVETVTPTIAFGQPSAVLPSNLTSSQHFDYAKYNPWGDGLIPQPESDPVLWHSSGMVGGVATANDVWRTVFWSVPLELLDDPQTILADTIGWLSDLGETSMTVDQPNAAPNTPRTFTINLRNLPTTPSNFVTVTNPLPVGLTIDVASLQGATYDSAQRRVYWSGELAAGEMHLIRYQATPTTAEIENRVQVSYARHNLTFEKGVTVWTDAPDLTSSTVTFDRMAFTLQLENVGVDGVVSADLYFPPHVTLITQTVRVTSGLFSFVEDHLQWDGVIESGETVLVRGEVAVKISAENQYLTAVAHIDDGVTIPIVRDTVTILYPPYRIQLPIIVR